MSELVPTGSKYSDDERMRALVHYSVNGSLRKTQKATEIPKSTLCEWSKSDWWVNLLGQLHAEKANEHRAQYSKIVSKAQKHTLKHLDKASPKDAMLIACMATDKVRLADNLPSHISSNSKGLDDLAKEFKALADRFQSTIVSEQ